MPLGVHPPEAVRVQDYDPLAAALREKGLLVDTAQVSRFDWGRNALGLLDPAYYRGTLQPRPVVDWCVPAGQAAFWLRRVPPRLELVGLHMFSRLSSEAGSGHLITQAGWTDVISLLCPSDAGPCTCRVAPEAQLCRCSAGTLTRCTPASSRSSSARRARPSPCWPTARAAGWPGSTCSALARPASTAWSPWAAPTSRRPRCPCLNSLVHPPVSLLHRPPRPVSCIFWGKRHSCVTVR